MKTILTLLLPFIGRHWLRIGIIGILLLLLNKKQIDLSIQLGRPSTNPPIERERSVQPVHEKVETPVLTERATEDDEPWVSQLNVFGGGDHELTLIDRLKQRGEDDIRGFILRFSEVAKTEQEKYGIPASIILANGLLHSEAGGRDISQRGHNFFGLDCSRDWVGPTTEVADGCYRAYQNAWTSFRDHSLYLTSGRYTNLPEIGKSDYRRWAMALEELNYGTTDQLAKQLLTIIDEWQLFQFD